MSDWIKAFNPAATIATEAEALKAARASAIAIFLGVAFGLLGVAILLNGGLAAVETAMTAAAPGDAQVASMTGVMAQAALYAAIGLVVVQLILGWVQWAKPNMAIPIIFLVLVVYGLGSGVLSLTMVDQTNVPQTPMNAPWLMGLNFLVLLVQLILHIAGVRGASALGKFRQAQAF